MNTLFKLSLALLPGLAGCLGGNDPAAPTAQIPSGVKQPVTLSQDNTPRPGGPKDPEPSVPLVFRLECYQLKLPVGSISRNEALWKRIDENCVDVATHDLLDRNGLRVGEAPYAEWTFIKNMIEAHPGTGKTMGTVAAQAKDIELEMRKNVPFQNVTFYDDRNELVGKSFDRCENIVNLSFQRAPRKLGQVRVALAPTVRSLRKRLEYTPLNDESPYEYKYPETFYLNVIVDIPIESFLIVAPSVDAGLSTSIGHTFFIADEPAEQMEQVLIIRAVPFRTDDPTMTK